MQRYGRTQRAGTVVASLLAGVLTMSGPVNAQSEGQGGRPPGEVIEETTRRMLEIFRNLIGSIPQYEAPVVLGNGDILIKRKRSEPEAVPPGEERSTRTRT